MSRRQLGSYHQGRVIAGQYKGRKIKYQANDLLRPTPDRLKETLFNWLMGDIRAAVCLDLFAGTGLLGIEALSRGAKQVVFVDQSAMHIDQLTRTLVALNAMPRAKLYQAIVPAQCAFLSDFTFDIVFLDPPFARPLHGQALSMLVQQGCLSPGAMLYCQWHKREDAPDLGQKWVCEKHYCAGVAKGGLFGYV